MTPTLLSLLGCPYCGTALERCHGDAVEASEYAILRCACSRYPVVAGIPILKKGVIGAGGRTEAELATLVEKGRHFEALLCMLTPPSPAAPALAPRWIRKLPSIRGLRLLKDHVHSRAFPYWSDEVSAFLANCAQSMTVRDMLDFYFQRSQRKDSTVYEYFAYRFGLPRHLVALSFSRLIHRPARPILELACGFGHITRGLVSRALGQRVIGVDSSFFSLYVAKNWIAPEAEYVCYYGDATFPFPDAAFAAVCCVDGLHYFPQKVGALREVKRVTHEAGIILLMASRNALVHRYGPTTRALYGHPLPPSAYRALMGDTPHRLVSDSDTLARYLKKLGPSLATSSTDERLSEAPLLSIVACQRDDVFRDHGTFDDWPHAEGRWMVNPLYRKTRQASDGTIDLTLTFPSAFYEAENAECKQYLPQAVTLDRGVLADIRNGTRTPDVERLLGTCVVLGVPDRYW